jgi:aminoglycoside phosphotransferase (APT) family kinase protein
MELQRQRLDMAVALCNEGMNGCAHSVSIRVASRRIDMATDSDVARQLTQLVRAKTGDAAAEVHALTTLPGHAGQSYSFELEAGPPTARIREKLVLRLAPEGVRIAGPADVVRQARIMESLAGTPVAVPPIRWYGDDPQWFGRPYFIVGFLRGDKLALGERTFTADETRQLMRATLETLAALHRVEWEPRRAAWGEPFSLTDEMARLDNLLDRPTLDPKVAARAPELRERLRATLPRDPRIGCVHGDFQWSNCLYDRGRLVAVIDWELAQTGAVLLDLGWLCLFSDSDSWVNANLMPEHIRTPDEVISLYREFAPFPVADSDVRWFRAFSGYRFGVITAFNLMLHRRGKRPDPTWEDIALSAPRLFERGLELLG